MKIGIIAPYTGMSNTAKELNFSEQDLMVRIEIGDLKEAIGPLRAMEQESFHAIISRGGTAEVIREHTSLPVIEVGVSGYDILRLLMMAREWESEVQLIGFSNVCKGFTEMMNIIDFFIPYKVINNAHEVENAIMNAKSEGFTTIIGDTVAVRLAEREGLRGILISSGKESIEEAVHQAKTTAYIYQSNELNKQSYQKMLDHVQDHFLILNNDGEIYYKNHESHKFIAKYQLSNSINEWGESFRKEFQKLKDNHYLHSFIVFDNLYWEVTGEKIIQDGTVKYYLKWMEEKNFSLNRGDVSIAPIMATISSLHQITLPRPLEQQMLMDLFRENTNLAIVGEKGTGKKTLASALHNELFEVGAGKKEIHLHENLTQESQTIIEDLISRYRGMLYFKGWEKIEQKVIAKWMEIAEANKQIKLIFSTQAQFHAQLLFSSKQIIYLPELSFRKEDLSKLSLHFITQYNILYGKQVIGVSNEGLEYLKNLPWSDSNLNKLRNIIRKAIKTTNNSYLSPEDISDRKTNKKTISIEKTLEELEKDIITQVMQEEENNQTRVAERLGINRSTLWRKLKSINVNE